VTQMRKQRKTLIIGATVLVAAGAGLAGVVHARAAETILVYQNPTCGCCGEWVEHLEAHGFRVRVDKTDNMAVVKAQYGVPQPATSCHTGIVGGYVIEGHVPADLIGRMLRERPEIAGLAVPGMPMGSPGMEGPYNDPYDVIAFTANGQGYIYDSR
jgi:hypothetical protein